MSLQNGRYTAAKPLGLAEGWSLERLTATSRLFGANGLRTGPDGQVYIAQVSGSQISALDLATGRLRTVSAKGGDIVAPDDVAFDPRGNLYATEVMDGRVSVLGVDGRTRVLRDDVPNANGITFHNGRLFIGECRIGGRIMELDPDSGAVLRVLLENVPMPNAMEVGPDGLMYFPVIGTNEIWRVKLDGGAPEVVAKDLGVPDAVKFDGKGQIVSTQVHSGQVLRIDPRSGDRTVLASLSPGLDNLTFVGDRLFVSNFTGEITEILGDGKTQVVLPGALNWPLDLAVDEQGNLLVADGTYLYDLQPGGKLRTVGMMFTPGYPGFVRGVAPLGAGALAVTNSLGQVMRYQPAANQSDVLAEGFDQLYGVAVAPGGAVVAVDYGSGRVLSAQSGNVEVLASGLREPKGVAIGPDAACFVSETGAGRVIKLGRSGVEPVLEGLQQPQGILVRDGQLYVLDAGAKTLIAYDLSTKVQRTIASELPVGAPPGVTPKPLRGLLPFSGPQGPFAGLAAGADGTLFVSADAEGSVLALRHRAS
jgi:sugar lactone lactonase YvrE